MSPHVSTWHHPRYDLDLARLADEELVVLAQECGYVPARDELICRCNHLKDRVIRRHAAQSGLQQADCMDAQQDGVLWIMEAIRQYKTEQQPRTLTCRFRTFLYRVLVSRFIDSLRSRSRSCRRLQHGGYTFSWLTSPPASQHNGSPAGPSSCAGDPQRGMEEDEFMARLRQEVDRLGALARELWNLLVEGLRLHEIAAVLDLSYDAVKRARRKLFAHLRACLGKEYST